MQLGKRQSIVIISVFAAGLAAFSIAYVKNQIAPKTVLSPRHLTTNVDEPQGTSSTTASHRQLEDYQIIGKRNLFARPVDQTKSGNPTMRGKAGTGFFPKAPNAMLPPFPSSFVGQKGGPSSTRSNQSPSIAATGIVRLNGTPYVLLEQVDQGETALVRIGERAFGYTLVSILGEQVTLAGRQGTLTLVLGENKSDKTQETAKPGASAGNPKTPDEAGKMGKAEGGMTPPGFSGAVQMQPGFGPSPPPGAPAQGSR